MLLPLVEIGYITLVIKHIWHLLRHLMRFINDWNSLVQIPKA